MKLTKYKFFEKYDSPDEDDDYEDDDLFGRPHYSKKRDIYRNIDSPDDDIDDEYTDEDIEQLTGLLDSYFDNQGIKIEIECDGLDIIIKHTLNKIDNLSNLTKVFNVIKKVKKDILPQYDSSFALKKSKDGRPDLCFYFNYNEGLGDDNPF